MDNIIISDIYSLDRFYILEERILYYYLSRCTLNTVFIPLLLASEFLHARNYVFFSFLYPQYLVCIFVHTQVALVVKNWPANAGDITDTGLIPGSGRSPGGGHDNPL